MSTPNAGPDHRAAKADAKATRPGVKTMRWWAAGLLLILIIGSAGCEAAEESEPNSSDAPSQSDKRERRKQSGAQDKPEMTSGQARALESAENYLEISSFSKAGLIQQLSSSAGDGFSKADATFAANHVDVDWKQEAVEAAKNYLEISPMSRDALIQQLSSSAGDKFTPAQARYAVNKVY